MLAKLALHQLALQNEAALRHDAFSGLKAIQDAMKATADVSQFNVANLEGARLVTCRHKYDRPALHSLNRVIGNDDAFACRG